MFAETREEREEREETEEQPLPQKALDELDVAHFIRRPIVFACAMARHPSSAAHHASVFKLRRQRCLLQGALEAGKSRASKGRGGDET